MNLWSDELDRVQEYIDQLIQELQQTQKAATQSLSFAVNLKIYLKEITGEQYYALQWYETLKSNLVQFGRHFDDALKSRADIYQSFKELMFFVENGDVPFYSSPINGCDGYGATEDTCGVCRGNNLTCVDCNGVPNGDMRMDVCAVCGDGLGSDCRYFCDGVPNSGKVEDLCGICNGNEKACVGCDSLPHSLVVYDTCGVCGGDGSSCEATKGCSGVVCGADIQCPIGQTVVNSGYKGCCFSPKNDCINSTITLL